MAQRSFGQLNTTLYDRRRRTRAALLLGVSLVVVGLIMPARAASITYSDGEARAAAVAMTEDTVGNVALDEAATQSGVISGAYKFSKAGFGSLALTGNNSFSGGLDLNMGSLILRHQNAAGTGLVTMLDNTSLVFDLPGTFNLANNVEIHGVTEFAGTRVNHTGVLSGDGRLLVNANVTLAGQNTYSGGTDIAAGQVTAMSNAALGSGQVTMANNAVLTFNAGQTLSFDNAIDLVSGYQYFNAGGPVTLNGVISGNGNIIKSGTGQLTLTGANTYTGGTSLNGGIVRVENDQALGSGDVYFQQDTRLRYADGITLGNELSTVTGSILQVDTGTATQAGDIRGSNLAGGYYKTGSGELVVLGHAYYGGSTNIVAGTLTAGADGVLSVTSLHILAQNARLNLLGDQTVGGISGMGTISLNDNILTLDPQRNTSTFAGTLMGTSDSGLVMTGSRALTLDGDNESYGGTLRVEGGPVYIQGDYSGMATTINGGILGGNGRLDAVVVNGGTLAGYDGYRLSMDSLVLGADARILAQLGASSSDSLFNVNGDLVLDGTLDVEDVGGFDPGIYRLFDYGGTLTDNGLEIGAVPGDYVPGDLQVQTSVAGQVNLLRYTAAAGDTLFWDGSDAALWENGRVDGGDGVWGSSESFTTADGLTNSYQNPSPGFVVFAGKAGTVAVEHEQTLVGDGDVVVTGMQFATSGYRIKDNTIEITAGDRIVRVGDGTAAGADYVATIDSAITGDGALIKSDLGTLVLNSDDNDYIGGTEVRAGTLEVNGTIGDILVGQNGRLRGSGRVGALDVAGTLSAGSAYPRQDLFAPVAFGTLQGDGDLTLNDTSLFEVKVDADGNADLVEVNGTAYLDGQVLALASGGDYAAAHEYTFLRAEDGIEGEFDGVSASLAFLDASLAYNENDVRLTLIRNAATFGGIGNTANQKATGIAVEGLGVGNAVYDRVLTLSADDARAGFDQLSGEVHASLKGALLGAGQSVGDTMNDRVAAAFARLGAATQDEVATGLSIWSSASGGLGVLNADGNAARTSYSAGNLFVGADAMFNQNWLFGAMLGYGQTNVSVADRSSSASSDNFHVGVYGGGEVEDFTFKFGAGYTHHDIDTSRTVTMPGFAESLFSTRSGHTGQVFGEIGHKFAFNSGLIVEPFANLAHASLFTGDFAEQGGAAALSGGSAYASTTHLTLGVRGETSFAMGELQATARGMMGWQHALGGVEPTSTQAFANGADFTVSGSAMARDSAIIEAGLDINLNPNVDLGVSYNGQFGSGMQQHGVTADLSVKF
jgi:autotransporter-associated beta strand protein